MNSPASIDGDRSMWARQALHLSGDGGPASMRTAVLDRLESEYFVVDQLQLEAIRTLFGGDGRVDDENYHRFVEHSLREDVEKFARELFALSPDERRARFGELRRRCDAFPMVQQRLLDLTPGLGASPQVAQNDPSDVKELAGRLRRIFTSERTDRVRRRLDLFRRVESDPRRWQGWARYIQREYPQFANLGSECAQLLDELAGLEQGGARLKIRTSRRDRAVRTGSPAADTDSKWTGWNWILVSVVFFSGIIVSMMSKDDRNETRDVRSQQVLMEELRALAEKNRAADQKRMEELQKQTRFDDRNSLSAFLDSLNQRPEEDKPLKAPRP